MVRMGLGISLVNELSARYWNEHLVKLPLDPPQTVTFGVAVPSREHMTNAAKNGALSIAGKEKIPGHEFRDFWAFIIRFVFSVQYRS